MFDTVLGVVGLATGLAGNVTSARHIRRIEIDLGNMGESVSAIQDQLRTLLRSGVARDQHPLTLAPNDLEEIALQLFRRLSAISNVATPQGLLIAYDLDQVKYIDAPPSDLHISSSGLHPALILPSAPVRLATCAPGGYAEFMGAFRPGRSLSVSNPEPVFLRVSQPLRIGTNAWKQRLAELQSTRSSEPRLCIDTEYWQNRLNQVGRESP